MVSHHRQQSVHGSNASSDPHFGLLSGDIVPWEAAGDYETEPEPEAFESTGAAAAAAETEEEEDDDDSWDGVSLVSSSAPSHDCRASTSDDDDLDDYEPLTAEKLNEKINKHAERRLQKEQERLGPLLTNPNDPRPWETAGGKVKWGWQVEKRKGQSQSAPKAKNME